MKLFLKILLIILWASLAAGAIVLMSFANRTHEAKICSGVEVNLNYNGSEPMLTAYSIKQQLISTFGTFEKKKLEELDLEKIQEKLQHNPYIEIADVHTSIEGKLIAEITQCKPIVRIISFNGQNCYLDEKGRLIPANPNYPVRVVVASGNIHIPISPGKSIFEKQKKKHSNDILMQDLLNIHFIARHIREDSVMNALVEQIFVKQDGGLQLATKAGCHLIEFGDTLDATEKISNLKAFYKYGLTKTGWKKYRIINLTYKNQIVCSK